MSICEIVKLPFNLAGMDRAFAALVEDLHTRGLLAETLVFFLTEFGRTPKVNKDGGRDHWGLAGSLFFAGGGTRGGQVIGATDRVAGVPTTPGHDPADVAATVYQAIDVEPDTLLYDRQNRPLARPAARPACPRRFLADSRRRQRRCGNDRNAASGRRVSHRHAPTVIGTDEFGTG